MGPVTVFDKSAMQALNTCEAAVSFLCARGLDYVTGQTLVPDGGQSVA